MTTIVTQGLTDSPSKQLISLVTWGLHQNFKHITMSVQAQSITTSIVQEQLKYVN